MLAVQVPGGTERGRHQSSEKTQKGQLPNFKSVAFPFHQNHRTSSSTSIPFPHTLPPQLARLSMPNIRSYFAFRLPPPPEQKPHEDRELSSLLCIPDA